MAHFRHRWLAGLLIVLALTVPASLLHAQNASPPAAAPAFTPAQRAEIIEIVRAAMKADPSILRDAVTALQADEARAESAAASAAIAQSGPELARAPGDPVAGNPNGDVTMVEFYDLHCPYCRSMAPVVAKLLSADPKLRLVYKDIPILGPGSILGARAVLAAERQGGYLRLHDAVMAGPAQITEDTLHQEADAAGLDWTRLRHDMDDPAIQARIDANLALAHKLGIQGTPVYVVGEKMLPGAVPLDQLQAAVAAARG
jgi:protein-disulfide isomerase